MREQLLKIKKSVKAIGFMLVMSCLSLAAHAQCSIVAPGGAIHGCQGVSTCFTVSGAAGATKATWSFNGNSTDLSPSASYCPPSANAVPNGTITVTLYDAAGQVICTSSVPFSIYANPVAQFILSDPNTKVQCFKPNFFQFINQTSTPSGNPIQTSFWSFGDGTDQTHSGSSAKDNGTKTYTTAFPIDQDIDYQIVLQVTDDKGCISTITKSAYVTVKKPMFVDFTSNLPRGCDSVFVRLTNISNIKYDEVKSFYWEWLDDGTIFTDASGGCDSAIWNRSEKWISKNICFAQANLIVESNFGCKDTATKNTGCNVVPAVGIGIAGGDNQCLADNPITFTHPSVPNLQSFLWNFGNPPAGILNFNNTQLTNVQHNYPVGIFQPSITLNISGCAPRTVSSRLFIKGPSATIESKPGSINFDSACNFNIIPFKMRYQCYIKDTVFFPNHSTYFLNDDTPFDDIMDPLPAKPELKFYTDRTPPDLLSTKKIYDQRMIDIAKRNITNDPEYAPHLLPPIFLDTFDFIIPGYIAGNRWKYCDVPVNLKVLQEKDTIYRIDLVDSIIPSIKPGCPDIVRKVKKKVIDNIVIRDYVELTDPQLPIARTNIETERVWDFDDAEAPGCTTDSRPIYMKSASDNNDWMPGPQGPFYPKNTYGKKDGKIFWVNCRYSNDSLPKHMYTPGKERCYTARLKITDNSPLNTDAISMTTSKVDPPCESESSVQLALQKPEASKLKYKAQSKYCYNDYTKWGVMLEFDRTTPSCDREMFWVHWDSAYDRIDGTPTVFDRWVPQDQTFPIANNFMIPWPMATLSLPPNTGTAFNEYNIGGTYPNAISSPDGWVTVGFRVQNGIDPVTKQPCIDEKWYHNAYRFIMADPRFWFPDRLGLPAPTENENPPYYRDCPNFEVRLLRHSAAYTQDSVARHAISWGDSTNSFYYDTFNRWVCNVVPNKCISYKKSVYIDDNGRYQLLDSMVTMIYNTLTEQVEFISAEDSIPTMEWKHIYSKPGRFIVSHQFFTVQRFVESITLPDGTDSSFIIASDCIETRSGVVISGFSTNLEVSDTTICRGDSVTFQDWARYYVTVEPPGGPDYDTWDWWADPTIFPDGSPRYDTNTVKRPYYFQYETIGYDFDDGTGMHYGLPDDPTYTFRNPGKYDVIVEYTDSTGCKIQYKRTVWVSGIQADFDYTIGVDRSTCRPIVKFADSSKIFDPCFTFNGVPCDYSDTILWDYGDNTQKSIFMDTVSHLYQKFGDYDVNLFVTTGNGCKDSITKTIVLEGPDPIITNPVAYKGCRPFSVEFVDKSNNPTASATYNYIYGDGTNDNKNTHTYDTVGTFYAYLELTDTVLVVGGSRCTKYSDSLEIIVYPKRIVEIAASDTILCPNEVVTLFATDKTDSTYTRFKWTLGDGEEKDIDGKQGDTITHSYAKAGVYYVTLTPSYVPVIGEPVCNSYDYLTIYVSDISARFDTMGVPPVPPQFHFRNTSINAVEYWWSLDDGLPLTPCVEIPACPDASYNYGTAKGNHTITLVARNEDGCFDTTQLTIYNDFSTDVNIPNVFTPDNKDDKNDNFDIYILNEEVYDLKIFNRWGEMVFESNNQFNDWNGTKFNTGNACPAGEYFVTFIYRLKGEEKEKSYTGTVTLIREP